MRGICEHCERANDRPYLSNLVSTGVLMGVGWIAAIIIGGLAGWLAGKLMDVRFGIFMNIVIGIVGAVLANGIFNRFNIHVADGWLGYLVAGFIGSCILLFLAKLVRR